MLFIFNTQAADIPYYFYQPKNNGHVVELSGANGNTNVSYIFSTSTVRLTTTFFYFSYAYGLTDNHAIGFDNNTGADTVIATVGGVVSTTKSTGLGDWDLWYKGNLNNFYYGLSVVPFSAKSKAATATQEGNRTQGGMGVTPYLGISLGDWGFKASIKQNMERKQDASPNPDTTITGGNTSTIEAYHEATGANSKRAFILPLLSMKIV